jgi:hypothetical protein
VWVKQAIRAEASGRLTARATANTEASSQKPREAVTELGVDNDGDDERKEHHGQGGQRNGDRLHDVLQNRRVVDDVQQHEREKRWVEKAQHGKREQYHVVPEEPENLTKQKQPTEGSSSQIFGVMGHCWNTVQYARRRRQRRRRKKQKSKGFVLRSKYRRRLGAYNLFDIFVLLLFVELIIC